MLVGIMHLKIFRHGAVRDAVEIPLKHVLVDGVIQVQHRRLVLERKVHGGQNVGIDAGVPVGRLHQRVRLLVEDLLDQ